MSWRPWLEDRALRQVQGLPSEAFNLLVRTLARICDDPYRSGVQRARAARAGQARR